MFAATNGSTFKLILSDVLGTSDSGEVNIVNTRIQLCPLHYIFVCFLVMKQSTFCISIYLPEQPQVERLAAVGGYSLSLICFYAFGPFSCLLWKHVFYLFSTDKLLFFWYGLLFWWLLLLVLGYENSSISRWYVQHVACYGSGVG